MSRDPAGSKPAHDEPAKPRLLWHSNAPHSPTGYGNQTALFTARLKEHYGVGISAFYGLEGNLLPWNGMPVYPGLGKTHGNHTIREHARVHFGDLRAGTVFSLMDVWVLDPAVWGQLNAACWVPVDHEPAPPPVIGFLKASAAVPVAMSRFGERMLDDAGLEPLYVPHAVDCSHYRPRDRAKARAELKMPKDAFVVGMVAANKGSMPSRKCFPEALTAFKLFRESHPEALLYLHTEVSGLFEGVDLLELCRAVGVDLDSVLFPDQYRMVHLPYPAEHMAKVYSAMDVLLSPSMGEGFGIPVIEAQACGTPVIVSDFSSQPELVGAGWTVEASCRFYTDLKSWQILPDVEDILAALRRCYGLSEGQRRFHADRARQFAEAYHVDRVLEEFMLPALEEITERFGDAPAEAEILEVAEAPA
jgi:D-inositol-3-phosphate glycosyltransferase